MEVIRLLQSKNRCLQKYLELSLDFLAIADRGDLSGLTLFQERRDAVLRALELYDRRISACVSQLPREVKTPSLSAEVESALELKTRTVQSILDADERIIRRIEAEKTKIRQEMAASERNKTSLQKFKSTWIKEAGEGLDEKL